MVEYRIEFEDCHRQLEGERRSKRLREGSDLYRFVAELREELDRAAPEGTVHAGDRAPRVELLNGSEAASGAALVRRAERLQNATVRVPDAIDWIGGAIAIRTPPVPGYDGSPHVTVHYYLSCADKATLLETAKRAAEKVMSKK